MESPALELLEQVEATFGGTYQIDRELTGGGMSRLFIAVDRELQRKVVIKILPPELTSDMMSARFRRESEVTARLQHPHILPVISAGVRDGLLFYVTPFIEGESLRHRMDREGQLPPREAVRLLRELSDALAYAHKLGIVHRDIKPENILIQDGHAVLADFGIAAALAGPAGETVAERITRTGMSVGTVGYMSPEQSFGERTLDGRSDIYSLGVVGHEMLAGTPPFTGPTAQAVMTAHLTEDPPRLDDLRDDVSRPVATAVRRALAKDPADRYQTAGELRDALEEPERATMDFTRTFRLRKMKRHRGRIAAGAVALVALVVAGAYGVREWRARTGPVEYVTIAVAPFNALDPKLELWREGLVDLMTRNLDGAGPVRTVAPVVAIRGFPVGGNLDSALALARRTRSQYAVYGRIGFSGSEDSVRISAEVVDMSTSARVTIERRAATVNAAADSLTLGVLQEVGRRHRIGAARLMSLGSTSVPAMRAFLQGEQFYRRTSWDSAGLLYSRAIAADPGFALALRRSAEVVGWSNGGDSASRALWIAAGRHNRGLAPRDSVLLSVDSMRAALATMGSDSLDRPMARRLFSTVNAAAVRYPDDPEVWYAVGEARFHYGYGSLVRTTERAVLDAFDRSIAIDSSFAPAYVHAIELAFTLDGEEKGRRYARRYLSHDPTGTEAEGIRLLERTLAEGSGNPGKLDSLADAIPAQALYNAWYPIRRWTDTAETALRLLRSMSRRPASALPTRSDTLRLRAYLSLELAYRGRMREAYASLGNTPARLVAELALFGSISPDSARAIFARWESTRNAKAFHFMPWLAARRDTTSLRSLLALADSQRSAGARGEQLLAQYNSSAASAYLSLARADTSDALTRFGDLPDALCPACFLDRWSGARLLSARGHLDEAEAILGERLRTQISPAEIWILAEHARVAARAGHSAAAAESWARVVGAWGKGDPEVQPLVREARSGLASLRGSRPASVGRAR